MVKGSSLSFWYASISSKEKNDWMEGEGERVPCVSRVIHKGVLGSFFGFCR